MERTQAIRIHAFGGPEVLAWEAIDLPAPGFGEVRVRHTAIGLNFIDTYHRTGLYPVPLPSGLGSEAAGVVEIAGPGVTGLERGDRVVYAGGPPGACAEQRNLEAERLVRIPDGLPDDKAAATFLKGLTAWYLLKRSYRVQPGDVILLYAAAGGVGLLAGQWADRLGATVIGVVGSEEKAALARAHGCRHTILATDDIPRRVRELTGGVGAAAVYDSVGRDTFLQSLDSLRPHGTLVSFGNASGPVGPFAPAELAQRGSLYLTRPTLFHFVPTREALEAAAGELFGFLGQAGVTIRIGQAYRLRETARAHRDLEARRTTGSTVLVP